MNISFILMTLKCDSRLILLGEIRYLSFLGVKGLTLNPKSMTLKPCLNPVPLNPESDTLTARQQLKIQFYIFAMGDRCVISPQTGKIQLRIVSFNIKFWLLNLEIQGRQWGKFILECTDWQDLSIVLKGLWPWVQHTNCSSTIIDLIN